MSSNPSSRSDKNHTHVKQVHKFSVIAQCRSTKSTKLTFLRKNTPVTGKDKTQRSYSDSNDPGSGVKSSNAHFRIPVTNRFESLSVLDENNTNCQIESNDSIVILKELHKHHKNSEFESSNLIESQNTSPSVKNVSNSVDQRRGNTRLLNTGTRCTQVKSHHKQSSHEQYNGHPLSHNSTSKMVQVADQKHGKMCPKNYPPEDKYELALTVKNKNKAKLQLASSDLTYQKWSDQNHQRFGFIPLGPLILPQNNFKRILNSDPIKLYDITKNSDSFNFMTTQIQVKSQLNPYVWEHCLQCYWDSQLCHLIRYGFPLDFNRTSKLGKNTKNHKSATMFPEDVEAYIQEEIGFGAIVGPFSDPPFQEFHVSPFMTREKPGGAHRRVIMDLSFPQGGAVNTNISKDSYLGTDFILTLPSIDHITNKIKQLGKGSLIYKVDMSRAFRHIKIDPRDYFLLGLKHKNYYLDTCLPFGYRNGSGIFRDSATLSASL